MHASAALAPAKECVPTLAYWPVNGWRSPKTIFSPDGAELVAGALALATGALAPGVDDEVLHAETTMAKQQINAAGAAPRCLVL